MAAASATVLKDNGGRFVPGLIAVLVYLAIVALAAMLLVGDFAERWREERDGRLSVQLAASANEEAARRGGEGADPHSQTPRSGPRGTCAGEPARRPSPAPAGRSVGHERSDAAHHDRSGTRA